MREQQRDERVAPKFLVRERALHEFQDFIQMVLEVQTFRFRRRACAAVEQQSRDWVIKNTGGL